MTVMAYSELGHVLERHVGNATLDTRKGENLVTEIANTLVSKTQYLFNHPVTLIICAFIIGGGLVAYSFAGKGSGSHAGREEVRRAYRRKLAQEMARDDAQKIKAGEKPRRRWMQW